MSEDNILKSINEGADISIIPEPSIGIGGGSFNLGENDWQLAPDTIFRHSDQILSDKILYNNLDIISDYQLFERMKNYEQKFNLSSEKFYKKWIGGKIEPIPEFYDWVSIYKNLLIHK